MRYREVHAYALISYAVLAIAALTLKFSQTVLLNISINLIFILILLLTLTLYYSLKNKKLVLIVDTQLGKGDIIFLLISACLLPVKSFFFFFFISTVSALLVELLIQYVKKEKSRQVPFISYMGCILSFFILVTILKPLGTAFSFNPLSF